MAPNASVTREPKGCSPDNAAAEGFFGRMKFYPEKWEEHTRNEVLALVDVHNHERIKPVAWLDEPLSKQMAA